MVKIRLLEPSEYDLLPIKIDPLNSRVVILEDDETKELKGYWCAQTVVHCEPVWLADDQRGTLNGIKMYAGLLAALSEANVKDFYCFSDTDKNDEYLIRLGLTLKPYATFLGSVPPMPQSQE